MKANGRKRLGYDATGHLDSAYVARLLELGREGRDADEDRAFVTGTESDDAMAEELGEAAVLAMTSGEDELLSALEAEVPEELGGPFVPTSGNTEFAGGTDESNIAEATREPFPLTQGGKVS